MAGVARHRGFGHVRRLPSGRYQASYIGPDLARHKAPRTFDAKIDAEGWLVDERRLIDQGRWKHPDERKRAAPATKALTLGAWAPGALERRTGKAGEPLRPTTLAAYESFFRRLIEPELGAVPLAAITETAVAAWYASLDPDRPTQRARAYGLLHSLLAQAVDERLIDANPARIRGAARARRKHRVEPLTPAEISRLADAMPPRLRLLVTLAGWCGLRFGELAELRRQDVDVARGVVHVSRAYSRVNGEVYIGPPKTEAGKRDVTIPPHVLPAVRDHLAAHVATGERSLLFTRADGEQLTHTAMTKYLTKARTEADLPGVRLHDLRHTAAVMAAQTGATTAELMSRLGHASPGAAMIYQHTARGRDVQIAAALSALVEVRR